MLNARGTSTLEYTIVMVLVMAAIITAGSYTIKGWNAQVQGWEDSVQDSFDDPLVEAPDNEIDLPECSCGPWKGSPPGDCYKGSCGVFEYLETRICIPLGCHISLGLDIERCTESELCCDDWVNAGCGDPPCSIWERYQSRNCGFGGFEEQCISDPTCEGFCGVPPPGGSPPPSGPQYLGVCAGDDPCPAPGFPWSTVTTGNCSDPQDAIWCQVECAPTYIGTGTICECPPGWAESSCTCPPGTGFIPP